MSTILYRQNETTSSFTEAVTRMSEQQHDKKEGLLRPYSVHLLLVWVSCAG